MALSGCRERCFLSICRTINTLMTCCCRRRKCKAAVCVSVFILVVAACGLLSLATTGHGRFVNLRIALAWVATITSFTTEKRCDNLSVANLTEPNARNSTIVLYSAHEQMHDGGKVVTVIGVADRYSLSSTCFVCRLSAGNALTGCHEPAAFWETLATVHELPEHHYEQFGAIFIHCPISAGHARPGFVSVIVNGTVPYLHTLRVTSPDQGPPRWQMALCVPPIHGGYNDWQQVVETLELLQMLGVDQAVMYTLDVGSNLTSVLDHYVRSGFLRLHAWPVLPQPVHYFGQMAAVNDCLLRMRNVSRLVMFSDLDEVIVPHQHWTLPELLKHVLKEHKDPDHVAAFDFLNAFYVSEFNGNETRAIILNSTSLTSDQLRLAESLGLRTVSRLYHGKIFKNTDRSKCIVDPLKVNLMQIHFVGKFANGFTSVAVNTDLALLHHYRVREDQEVLVRETSALQFASELIDRVTAVWTALRFQIKTWNQTQEQGSNKTS